MKLNDHHQVACYDIMGQPPLGHTAHICADCGAEWTSGSLTACPECSSIRTAELSCLLPLLEAQHGKEWRAECFPARLSKPHGGSTERV